MKTSTNDNYSTELIFQKVENHFNDAEIQRKIKEEDTAYLEGVLVDVVKNWPTFGDYLYAYLYDHCPDLQKRYSEFTEVPEDEYWEEIKKNFASHGMGGCGSVHESATTPLSKKRALLNKPSFQGTRDDVFLFAFGLEMDAQWTEKMLTKALLQHTFNPKDYREVIMYYCLKHTGNGHPYENYKNWMANYETLEASSSRQPVETGTIVRSKTLSGIQDDAELTAYLMDLKRFTEEQKKLHSATEEYNELFRMLPHSEEMLDQKEVTEFVPGAQESDWMIKIPVDWKDDPLVQLTIKNLEQLAQDAAIKYPEQELLDKHVLEAIFVGVPKMTKKTCYARLEGSAPVNRQDLLFLAYIVFIADFQAEQQKQRDDYQLGMIEEENVWDYYYYKFREEWVVVCNRCNLYNDLYIRNPFELFLVICSLKDQPREYFLASWARAVKKTD